MAKLSGNIRKNKKHFVIYNNNGVISATTPKDWARANQHLFPNSTFQGSNNTPTVNEIENVLKNSGFAEINNFEIVIHYQYNNL
jgi:pectate lyase